MWVELGQHGTVLRPMWCPGPKSNGPHLTDPPSQDGFYAGGDEDPSYYEVSFASSRGRHQYQMEDRQQLIETLIRLFPSKFKAPYGLPKGITITF